MSSRRDEGLTVVELLISIMILGIIMAPLATSMVIGLATTRGSEIDAGNSADAQLLAGFFDIDVASAENVQIIDSLITCGTDQPIVQFRWRDGAIDRHVTYEVVNDVARQTYLNLIGPIYELQRVVCSDAAGTEVETHTLARTLTAVPVVSCDNGSGCSTTTPRRVTLRGTAYATQLADVDSANDYTFGVSATRKVQP